MPRYLSQDEENLIREGIAQKKTVQEIQILAIERLGSTLSKNAIENRRYNKLKGRPIPQHLPAPSVVHNAEIVDHPTSPSKPGSSAKGLKMSFFKEEAKKKRDSIRLLMDQKEPKLSYSQIASRMKMPSGSVSRIMSEIRRERGVPKLRQGRDAGKKISARVAEALAEAEANGETPSPSALAAKMKITKSTVYYHLAQLRRKASEPPHANQPGQGAPKSSQLVRSSKIHPTKLIGGKDGSNRSAKDEVLFREGFKYGLGAGEIAHSFHSGAKHISERLGISEERLIIESLQFLKIAQPGNE